MQISIRSSSKRVLSPLRRDVLRAGYAYGQPARTRVVFAISRVLRSCLPTCLCRFLPLIEPFKAQKYFGCAKVCVHHNGFVQAMYR